MNSTLAIQPVRQVCNVSGVNGLFGITRPAIEGVVMRGDRKSCFFLEAMDTRSGVELKCVKHYLGASLRNQRHGLNTPCISREIEPQFERYRCDNELQISRGHFRKGDRRMRQH